jgi:hypothetical protein
MTKQKTNIATRPLLSAIETFSKWRTGKTCHAWVQFAPVIGIGKFNAVGAIGLEEHYVFLFTVVTIFTPAIGETDIEND